MLFILYVGSLHKKFLYTERDIGYNFFISFSFFDLEETNSQNLSVDTGLLKSIFFETIHTILVKEDLRTFKPILDALKKPFVNFWIVNSVICLVATKVVYIFFDSKRYFKVPVSLVNIVTLLFITLFYFKLHLKTHKTTLLVLRC